MSLDKPAMPAAAPTKLGRYTLVKELAGSGVGSTWLARGEDRGETTPKLCQILRLHRHVTKKVELAEAILNEARQAQKLRHDNVVAVVETGVSDGEVFVVSDYVEGETLGGLIAAAGTEGLPMEIVLRIGLDVLEALSAAHAVSPEPLVHGELNPWNVTVSTAGVAKVSSFGIARALARIGNHGIKGPDRLAYAPPERVKHMASAATATGAAPPLDPRSDIFSAGVMLWELVTRQRLFASKMEAAVIQKVLTAPIASVREASAGSPIAAEVEQAIAKALERDPARRFGNVSDFVFALEEAGPDKIGLAEKVAAFVQRLSGKALAQRKSEIDGALAGGAVGARGPAAPRARAATLLGIPAGGIGQPVTNATSGVNVPAPAGAVARPPGAPTAELPVGRAALPTPPPDAVEDVEVFLDADLVESVRASKIIAVDEPVAGDAKPATPEPPQANGSPQPPAAADGAPKRPRIATLLGFVAPSEESIEKAKAEAARLREAREAKAAAAASPPVPPPAAAGKADEEAKGVEPPGRPVSGAGAPPVPPAKAAPPKKFELKSAVAKPAATPPETAKTLADAKPPPPPKPDLPKPAGKTESPKPPPARPRPPTPAAGAPATSSDTPSPTSGDSKPRGKAGEAVDKLRPGVTLGRYEILMPVARGGMAAVWAARLQGTRGFSKIVAIKTMLPDVSDDPDFETMFLDEARVAAKIRHPNVAEIMDLGEENDVLYLVMEWVDGETTGAIQKAAKTHGGIPLPIVLRIASQACAGLHAAHELRDDSGALVDLVHRDISPANVLVSAQGFVKLVDFGIAKSKGRLHVTRAGDVIKGKTPYLSPEQLGGLPVNRRSDIFSLGALLYVLTTGLHPFRGDTDVKTVENIALKAAVPLRELVPTVHPDFEKIVLKALEKDPSKRFATAAEMQRALDQVASAVGSPVTEDDVAAFVKKVVGDLSEKRAADLRAATVAADAPAEAKPKIRDDITEEISSVEEVGPSPTVLESAPPPGWEKEPEAAPVDGEADTSPAEAAAERTSDAVDDQARPSLDPEVQRRKRLATMVVVGAVAGCGILGLIALARSGPSTPQGSATVESAAPVRTGAPVETTPPPEPVATAAPTPAPTPEPPPVATTEPVKAVENPPPEPPPKPAPPEPKVAAAKPAAAKPPPKPAAPAAKPPPAKPSKPAAPKPTTKKYNPKGI